jgi:hypothetical protein
MSSIPLDEFREARDSNASKSFGAPGGFAAHIQVNKKETAPRWSRFREGF